MHQAFNCNYHQHLLDYRTGSLPQIQRSVAQDLTVIACVLHKAPMIVCRGQGRQGRAMLVSQRACAIGVRALLG